MCETTALVKVEKPVIVVARPHPLSIEKVSASLQPGLTVREIVGEEAKSCTIEIGGFEIPEFMWGHVRPKSGTIMYVTRFPQGGGGGGWKMIFRLAAFAALAVLTYGIATGVAWLPEAIQGLSAGAAMATAAVVGIGGSLLINALIPPASTGVGKQTSAIQLQGISGVQNSMDPYGAVTCVFGTMLLYPKLASRSYTELNEDDQFVRALFDLGYGQLETANLQIGADPLTNFTGIEYEIGPSPDLFPYDVVETAASNEMDEDGDHAQHVSAANADQGFVDLIFANGLFAADSSGTNITATCKIKIELQLTGDPTIVGAIVAVPVLSTGRSTSPITATVTISGDGIGATAVVSTGIVGSSGPSTYLYGVHSIVMTNNGSGYTTATATLTVSGAGWIDGGASIGTPTIATLVGGSAFQNVIALPGFGTSHTGVTNDGTYIICSSSERKAFRVSVYWQYPQRGQYTVRVTRFSTDWSGAPENNRSGALSWTVLRSVRYAPASVTPTTKLGMRIKATDQLNGSVSQLNLLVTQIIPVWDGSAWTDGRISNPAWILRWLLKDCPANPRRVDASRIDDDELKLWGAECADKGFSFNYINDSVTTVFELIKIITAAGRASITVKDGKYSVVRDIAQTTPVQIFSPRNTVSFQGSRAFVDEVHALRVQFINPQASYQQDELIVYDDGFDESNATKFEQLQIPGCADAPMAWRLGRYHMAVARLRPNSYTWNCDVEHLICNRGDLVYFAHDVISSGISWGRVKSVTVDGTGNVTSVTIDEPVDLGAGTVGTFAMRFRKQDGTVATSVVTFAFDNAVREFTLSTPTPNINIGDLYLFGLSGQDSIPLLVSKIEPGQDLTARITAVDAAPAVLDADAGYIDSTSTHHDGMPPLISSITGQAWQFGLTDPTFVANDGSLVVVG